MPSTTTITTSTILSNVAHTSLRKVLVKLQESQEKKQRLCRHITEQKPHLSSNIRRNQRIKECVNEVSFRECADGTYRLQKASFCKYDRFCLACATRRAIRNIKKFEKHAQKHNLREKHRYHITLTIRHNDSQPLEEVLGKLMQCRDKLAQSYKNSQRKEQKTKSFFASFIGMIASVEVSYSNAGRHPHIHMIACSNKPIQTEWAEKLGCFSNKVLQKEWYAITQDSFQVGIKEIDVVRNRFNRSGVAEVFKYAMKFSSLSVSQLADMIELQKKNQYRFLSTYGCFRKWDDETTKKEKT